MRAVRGIPVHAVVRYGCVTLRSDAERARLVGRDTRRELARAVVYFFLRSHRYGIDHPRLCMTV